MPGLSRLSTPWLFVLAALAAPASVAWAQPRHLDLAIGDPARRDRQTPVVLDAITDTRTGELLTPDELAQRLATVRLVVIGEEHTSAESHRVQLALLEALARRGRPLLLGLEMFPASAQSGLDGWNEKLFTEEGFVRHARWYEHWGYPFGYYRDLFLFARERGIPVFGVNAPREVVSAVRRKGFSGLSPEESAHLPPVDRIDLGGAEARTLFRSYFDEGDSLHGAMSDADLDGMRSAQTSWDAAMAANALAALARHGGSEALMVVLAGSGHAAYGLGIELQAKAQGFSGRTASVIPVATADASGRAVTQVRASYADFVWGVVREPHPRFPELGAWTTLVQENGAPALKVVFVQEGSPAARAGLAVGDLILDLDGRPIVDKETWSRTLAAKSWGDRLLLAIRRGEERTTLPVDLRREGR